MDSIPDTMIVTPVLLPLFRMLEIDPLHAGVFMGINQITGLATPPVGCCLFAASIFSNESMGKISITILPFLAANVFVVMLVTCVSSVSCLSRPFPGKRGRSNPKVSLYSALH
jgi:TRAP-type C4-dicarboxylate transport system permease large subunit